MLLPLLLLLQDCPQLQRYADELVEARKAKALSRDAALDMLADLNMFGVCVWCGGGSGVVGWRVGGGGGGGRVLHCGAAYFGPNCSRRSQPSHARIRPVPLLSVVFTAGTMMGRCGDADGMVSGASCTTANTIRPALQVGG